MEENKKTLIASGCSFTHQPWSWAYKLKEIILPFLKNINVR